jgi:uncharacterized phage protein (TIGR01671 family)
LRESKFRAWDKEEKRFWYFTLQEVLERRLTYRGSWDEKILRGEKTQYTGLKDKNGKEIYEGDILNETISKSGILKNVIVYGHAGFEHQWLVERAANIRGKKQEPMFRNTSIVFEVIGNIYEDPELLEGRK